MARLIALALANVLLILVSGLNPDFADPAASVIASLFIVAALLDVRVRDAMGSLWRAYKPAIAAIFALAALLLAETLVAGDGGWAARRAAIQLILFALAGVSAGALAAVEGRNLAGAALIWGGAGAGVIIVALGGRAQGPLGALPPGLETMALTAQFGLLALLSCFLAADELRRRPSPGGRTLAPLSRRLFAPATGIFVSYSMLFLAGAAYALGALSLGLLAFAAAWALRSRRSAASKAVTPVIAAFAIAAAGVAVLSSGAGGALPWLGGSDALAALRLSSLSEALHLWRAQPLFGHGPGALSGAPAAETPSGARLLAETGLIGALALAALIGALMFAMGVAKDRGRVMTRGFTLLAGALVFAVLMAGLCPSFSSSSTLLLSAMLTGLAASYLDERKASAAEPAPSNADSA